MSLISRRRLTEQPTNGPISIDWYNPLSRGLYSLMVPTWRLDVASGQKLTITGATQTAGANGINWNFGSTFTGNRVDSPQRSNQAIGFGANLTRFSILAVIQSNATNGSTEQVVCNVNFNGATVPISLGIGTSTPTGVAFFDGAWHQSGVTTSIEGDGKWHVIIGTVDVIVAGQMTYYIDGKLDKQTAQSTSGATNTNVNPISYGNYISDSRPLLGNMALGAVWRDRALTINDVVALSNNPWQLFKPIARRLWKGITVITSNTGSATETLKPLTETAGANIGSVSGAVETLKAITESAAGQIPNQGFASETLKALTETSGSKIGSVSGASETLKALTESATGQTTTNNLTGGSADTLRALVEASGAQIGSVASASDVLKAITAQATGFTPTQIQVTPSAGGAPAWYGYEGNDGTRRPWWYKDLKDKAKELERLKKLRIELGILPKEVKKITKLIDEIDEFVEETPTPATANYYIAKQEELADRIEKLVDQMEEEEDEKAVMNMSKFFFHHNSCQ